MAEIKEKIGEQRVPRIEVREKLHGHTQILLRDVRTGKVKRVESDNLVTDGMSKLIARHGAIETFRAGFMDTYDPRLGDALYAGGSPKVNHPLWHYLLGGIVLFDSTIPTDKVFAPAGTQMVANGMYSLANNTAVSEMGSYSMAESGVSGDTITLVYDWTTAQGNGQIASVCLTNLTCGYMGYGNATSKENSIGILDDFVIFYSPSGRFENLGGLSKVNLNTVFSNSPNWSDFAWAHPAMLLTASNRYQIIPESEQFYTSGGSVINFRDVSVSFKYRKYKIGLRNSYSVFDNFNDPAYEEVVLSIIVPSAFVNGYNCKIRPCNIISNHTWQITICSDVAANGTINFGLIDAELETYQFHSFQNKTGATVNSMIVLDSTYSLLQGTNGRLYKVAHADGTVVGEVGGSDVMSAYIPIVGSGLLCEGRYFLQGALGNENAFMYDVVLNKIFPFNGYYSYGGQTWKPWHYPSYDPTEEIVSWPVHDNNYQYEAFFSNNPLLLSTINNLSSPVTKTTNQSMKVTYTITRAS